VAVRLRHAGGIIGCALLTLAAGLVLALDVAPRVLPYRAYAILGGSMEPTIPFGSEVVLRPVRADQLRIGDIITFRKPGDSVEFVTHRIVRVERSGGRRYFLTKGDANALPDAWRVPATGTGWRYAFTVPFLGYVSAALDMLAVRLVALVLVAVLVGATVLREIWRPAPRLP